MKKIAIIGAGVSGLTCARLLQKRFEVRVFEKESKVGGLIRCERVNGSLFHICGGHVFNTKNQRVMNWFWSVFNKERDFVKTNRNSAVCLSNGAFVDYPIENHVYQLSAELQKSFYADVEQMIRNPPAEPTNFGDFLEKRFGRTLYDLYFKPYNAKVWRCDLSEVPLSWLEGKLPMPTPQEMIEANQKHLKESEFVHSSFYYEKQGGSQFLADTLARGQSVICNARVDEIRRQAGAWLVNGQLFDKVIFCGNIKDLPGILSGCNLDGYAREINDLASHGTTAVFCETDSIPYSWFYQPNEAHQSHRFICTGNFSPTNNAPGKHTCTIEFTDEVGQDEIAAQLPLMPFHPHYITHHYSRYTYPIQHHSTREMIASLKERLRPCGLYLCGRFAEWEYFNMDAAMASAMKVSECFK